MRRLAFMILMLLLSNSVLAEVHESRCAETPNEARTCSTESAAPAFSQLQQSPAEFDCPADACHFGHCCALKSEHEVLIAALDPVTLFLQSSLPHPDCSSFRFERPPRISPTSI